MRHRNIAGFFILTPLLSLFAPDHGQDLPASEKMDCAVAHGLDMGMEPSEPPQERRRMPVLLIGNDGGTSTAIVFQMERITSSTSRTLPGGPRRKATNQNIRVR